MKILLIIPAYNESKNIERVVENLEMVYPGVEYLIVNDGSTDETAEICRQRGYPLLDLPINLGLTGAFQAGMKFAAEKGYGAVLQFDGDGQHDAAYIEELLQRMERNKLDIVIGSRFYKKKKPHTLRMFGSTLISLAIQLTTGKQLSDPTSGMRLFNARMIKEFAENINYTPEPDTISYLLRCGASVEEVQVEMHERIAGTSYLSLGRSMRYMLNMFVSILFVQCFRPRRILCL